MKPFRLFTVATVLAFLSVSPAKAYTSTDYYDAGLRLYDAQNYSRAIQYFNAAIQMDPTNAAALQGRGNCYYSQGRYRRALDDYQKVQALQPSPQLASMIQALQGRLGAGASMALPTAPGSGASPALPPPSGTPALGDPFSQGVVLFQQQEYTQAVPYFQKAAQDNPKDSKAYYYLGICQVQSGDVKDAAVDLGISDKLSPNPSVENYTAQLKDRLSPDDQQWVDGQVAASTAAAAAAISSPSAPKNFGIRLEPAIVMINPSDLTAEAQAGQSFAKNEQNVDPSYGYSATVPQGYANFAVEPLVKMGPHLELGIPIALGLIGSFTETGGSAASGVTATSTYAFTAFSVGLNIRYLFSLGKDMDLFVAGGPLLVPLNINLSSSLGSQSINLSSIGFGGQVQLGMDYHLTDSIVAGPFAGYQLADVSGFTGSANGSSGELYIYTSPTPGQYPLFTAGNVNSPPAGTRPLAVDLSGPYGGLQVSAFF